jgi:hypothetical protein
MKSDEIRRKPTRLITRELHTVTQSVQIIRGAHTEHSVNTREHTLIHDTQSKERVDC